MSSKLSTKVAIPPGVSEKLYRTKMCNYYKRGEECKYHDKCFFAHGDKELRPLVCCSYVLTFIQYSLKDSLQATSTMKMRKLSRTLMTQKKTIKKSGSTKIWSRWRMNSRRCSPRRASRSSCTLTKSPSSKRRIGSSRSRLPALRRKSSDLMKNWSKRSRRGRGKLSLNLPKSRPKHLPRWPHRLNVDIRSRMCLCLLKFL